jgi:hypothetical protein
MPYSDPEVQKAKQREFYLRRREHRIATSRARYSAKKEEILRSQKLYYGRTKVLTGEGHGHGRGREFQPGMTPWNKGKKGAPAWNKGIPFREESKIKLSASLKGRTPPNKGVPSKIRGDKHYAWRGGVTPLHEKERKSRRYAEWRTAVFQRDNFTCVLCAKHGGYLHADHIKPFSMFPALRLDVSNGRTLCVPCHKATPTYGRKALTFAASWHNL